MKINIGSKIIAGFAIILLLMLTLAIYSVNVTEKSLEESVGQSAVFLADEMMKRINQEIHSYIEQMQLYAENIILKEFVTSSNEIFAKVNDIEEVINRRDSIWRSSDKLENVDFFLEINNNMLSKALREVFIDFYEKKYDYSVFSEVFVTNKYGVNVSQTGKTTDYKQNDEKWWKVAKNKGIYISNVQYDESTKMHVIAIGLSIEDEKSNFIGAVKGTISSDQIARTAEFTIKKHKTAEVKLLTKKGNLIYSSKPYTFLEDISDSYLYKNLKGESGYFTAEQEGSSILFSYTSSAGFADFKGLPWLLIVEHDTKEILRPAYSLRKNVIIVSAFLILLGIIFAFLISRSIALPLRKLTKGVKRIGKGDLSYKIDINREDEIGDLAQNFNQMTEDLKKVTASHTELDKEIEGRKKVEKELRESEKKLQKAQEIAAMGNFEWNFRTNQAYWSEQLYKIHGRDPQKGVPSYKEYLKHVHPDDRSTVKDNVKSALNSGEYNSEYRIKRFDNKKIRFVLTKGIVRFDDKNKPILLEATEQDITERKEAEKKLDEYRKKLEEMIEARTEKLKETQKKLIQKERLATLGELAGGISHEIRNPLATIDSSAVNLEMQNYKDDKLKQHLDRIRKAVKKCVYVINSLRRLTKKEEPTLKKLNINKILQSVIEKTEIPPNIEMNLQNSENIIFINGDETQLRICFGNIISNALDAIEDKGKITIFLQKINSKKCKITITDTGIGLDEDKLDKIFEPLYSLKTTGIGFGLPLVKQIIESHNGKIKLESEKNKGTKFIILLPILD